MRRSFALLAVLLPLAACAGGARVAPDEHAGHDLAAPAAAPPAGAAQPSPYLPASGAEATARLAASPRHGEWVRIPAGGADSVRAWVVYPERKTRAPVVLVVHEIFGLSNWIRAVADQLAAEGFIAIAPDLLTGKNVPEGPEGANPDSARAVIGTLKAPDVQRRLDAAARYGMALPAALPRYGIVGFCWGGSTAFAHAVHAPRLGAAVVYYGTSPDSLALDSVRAPVLGLYGENDARVNATIPRARTVLGARKRTYEALVLPGAGHGFLRQQDGQNGANLAATRAAWPRTLDWFRTHLEKK